LSEGRLIRPKPSHPSTYPQYKKNERGKKNITKIKKRNDKDQDQDEQTKEEEPAPLFCSPPAERVLGSAKQQQQQIKAQGPSANSLILPSQCLISPDPDCKRHLG
jgi:hypothetical protein